MKSKLGAVLAAAGCALILNVGGAKAAMITETINFTASGFQPAGAPVDPVMGSFTITLDPAVNTSFATTITFNNVNITPGASAPFFFYSPTAREGLLLCAHPLFLQVVVKQRGSTHLTSEW
jgi:hypothetical protein